MAVGSLAETTSALTPCWAAVLMYCTWASGLAASGADLFERAAELLDGLLATGVAGVEVRVAEVLRQERDGDRLVAAAVAAVVGAAVAASSLPQAARAMAAARSSGCQRGRPL